MYGPVYTIRPMPIYDVTVPLYNELPTYPGDPGIQIRDWLALSNGDAANVSVLNFGAHTGTHVDAPAHFIEGAAKVESLALDVLIGEAAGNGRKASVVDLNGHAAELPAQSSAQAQRRSTFDFVPLKTSPKMDQLDH